MDESCFWTFPLGDLYKKINDQKGKLFTEDQVRLLVYNTEKDIHCTYQSFLGRYWIGLFKYALPSSMFMTERFYIETSNHK